jgi:hypothetical protein
MKRDDLKKLGLTDDAVIDAIMEAHGKDVEKFKTSVDASKTEAETLRGQLADANTQIEKFKGMDVDGIKAAADDYKAKFENAQKESAAQLAKVKFDHALERELKETYKVKDPRDVIPHLKADKIQFEEDKFIGLDEQMKPLKESKEYLFADVTEPPRIVSGGNNQPVNKNALEAAFDKGAGIKEK